MRFVVVLFVLLASRPSDACSMRSDLRIAPTLVERIEETPSIVIAEILPEKSSGELVAFEVREVMRGGKRVGDRFFADGVMDAIPLCSGSGFFQRFAYVFLLSDEGDPLHHFPIERKDPGERFVLAELVRITNLPVHERAGVLRAARDLGRAKSAAPDLVRLANEIDRHFAMPTPLKSFAELEPMLALQRDPPGSPYGPTFRDHVIHSIGLGGDPAAASFMAGVFHELLRKDPIPREEFHAALAYLAQVTVPSAAFDLLWLSRRMDSTWPWWSEMLRAMQRHEIAMHEALHALPFHEARHATK